MKTLWRLIRFILVVAAVLVVGFILVRKYYPELLLSILPLGSDQAVSELMEVPDGFESQADYTVQTGTEISGVGTVEDGFTYVGTDKVEFVLGYTIGSGENATEGLGNEKAEMILDIVLSVLGAVGFNDSHTLLGMESLGDESVGITFTTAWKESTVRVDALIFRKGATGAIAAVGYIDGQLPSVSVAEVARNLEAKIK